MVQDAGADDRGGGAHGTEAQLAIGTSNLCRLALANEPRSAQDHPMPNEPREH